MDLKTRSKLKNIYYSAFIFYRGRSGGLARNPIDNKELLKVSNYQKERYLVKYCDLLGFDNEHKAMLIKNIC